MFRVKKQRFTLIELLIAMALAGLLLAGLGYFYRQLEEMGNIMDRDQARFFEQRYVENRLADVFPKTYGKGVFFLANPASDMLAGSSNLIFQFDNCVRLDKQFAYIVTGRLYVDSQGKLTLARWPAPKFWAEGVPPPVKKEVLMEGVDSLNFLFFVAPLKEKKDPYEPEESTSGKNTAQKDVNQEKIPIDQSIRGTWIRDWKREWKEVPAAVRLEIGRKNEKIVFAYPILVKTKPITYSR